MFKELFLPLPASPMGFAASGHDPFYTRLRGKTVRFASELKQTTTMTMTTWWKKNWTIFYLSFSKQREIKKVFSLSDNGKPFTIWNFTPLTRYQWRLGQASLLENFPHLPIGGICTRKYNFILNPKFSFTTEFRLLEALENSHHNHLPWNSATYAPHQY